MADEVVPFRWPEGMPAGCPPSEAHPATLEAYRLVNSNPPTDGDFLRPIDKPCKSPTSAEEACSNYALSVFTDPGDIGLARQFIPGFKKKLAAVGHIEPEYGVVLQAPFSPNDLAVLHSHHDWWVTEGHDPKTGFAVVMI
jgi:hypothetical protein